MIFTGVQGGTNPQPSPVSLLFFSGYILPTFTPESRFTCRTAIWTSVLSCPSLLKPCLHVCHLPSDGPRLRPAQPNGRRELTGPHPAPDCRFAQADELDNVL